MIITILHTPGFKNQIGVCTKVTTSFAPSAKPQRLKTNEIIGSDDKALRSTLGLMILMVVLVMIQLNYHLLVMLLFLQSITLKH